MKTKRLLTVTLLACSLASLVHADSWGPIEQTEFFSENREYMLRIEPHPDWPRKPGHCHAKLFEGKKEVWSRHLINDHAPVRVFVADSGEYVLTMDEWGSVGELPVVIYGRLGRLVRVHSIDSLGLRDDARHIVRSVSSYWWNEDSISFFGPEDKRFFIRLHWGEWIILDLHQGGLLQKKGRFYRDDLREQHESEWKELVEYRQRTLATHAIGMLESDSARDRKVGALVCGQAKLADAIPKLSKLLDDQAYISTNVPKPQTRVYFVRKAAKEALHAMGREVDGVVTQEPDE